MPFNLRFLLRVVIDKSHYLIARILFFLEIAKAKFAAVSRSENYHAPFRIAVVVRLGLKAHVESFKEGAIGT